ncbi:MAG: hypothetical protein HQM07_01005 [Zetaproteobacteria bacterium]|nr:hypothetical protein [Zetaproteobacteria bacterium]
MADLNIDDTPDLRILHTRWENGDEGWVAYLDYDSQQFSTIFINVSEYDVAGQAKAWRQEIVTKYEHEQKIKRELHAQSAQHRDDHLEAQQLRFLGIPHGGALFIFLGFFIIFVALAYTFQDDLRDTYKQFTDKKIEKGEILDGEFLVENIAGVKGGGNRKGQTAPPDTLEQVEAGLSDEPIDPNVPVYRVEADTIIGQPPSSTDNSKNNTTASTENKTMPDDIQVIKIKELVIKPTPEQLAKQAQASNQATLPEALKVLVNSDTYQFLRSKLKVEASKWDKVEPEEIRKNFLQEITTLGSYSEAQKQLYAEIKLGALMPWLTRPVSINNTTMNEKIFAVQKEVIQIAVSLKGAKDSETQQRVSNQVLKKIWDDAIYGKASKPFGVISYD